jgi:heme-degrading monooxygenase HmoA
MASGPHIVTVFRSRLREGGVDGYGPVAARMFDRVHTFPGLVDVKSFTAPDGERVTIVEFDSREHHDAWRDDHEHRDAQRRGRAEFYASYSIQVCEVVRANSFEA